MPKILWNRLSVFEESISQNIQLNLVQLIGLRFRSSCKILLVLKNVVEQIKCFKKTSMEFQGSASFFGMWYAMFQITKQVFNSRKFIDDAYASNMAYAFRQRNEL